MVNSVGDTAISDYAAFQRRVANYRDQVCRQIYRENQSCIRVKKEEVAVCRMTAIFEKTLEISNRTGFQAMSVRDLSEATGISMGALYSYIESKERLLDMILGLGSSTTRQVLNEMPQDTLGARAKLRWFLRTHLYLTEAMQPWFYFSYMESRHFGKEAREKAIDKELATERLVADYLQEGIAEGEFATDEPELTAAAVKPLLQDWYLKRWKFHRRDISVDHYADF
ncbi:hypothetical protein CAI21_17845 [Alkalilimnicola ehrlichii]|uniref:HTH tetR-type domain-containing protein n=2 Tax=Alkalilimnicola ehrlichii TaxID=351052 RepID=A0A3E0WG56_9GAMM|nr:TetR/AcrR family transcriptional regulator [Alkalilimnicola ehrlichii]RFA26189.1 hypothetical protein CAI21_17845 [Alkalilimnicola ehrlichii]RFA31708.1 hypothetical protein CAL65_21745 [Alkalilimnicola ehrlichii]